MVETAPTPEAHIAAVLGNVDAREIVFVPDEKFPQTSDSAIAAGVVKKMEVNIGTDVLLAR